MLHLSIGENVPARRLGNKAWNGVVPLYGKPVQFEISESGMAALAQRSSLLLVELELYFSCLVRKQIRFNELREGRPDAELYTRVLPRLYTRFHAVTTKECRCVDVGDNKPPVATMPVKKPGHFVPDKVKIDYRAGVWRGEYGIDRSI